MAILPQTTVLAIFDSITVMSETIIYLSQENLLHNLKELRRIANHTVWPVLKSNAYGHGLSEVAAMLQDSSAEYFIVQNYFEAEQVWKITKRPILMLGTESFEKYAQMAFSDLVPVVGSLHLLKTLITLDKEINIHIKINTGMNRQGFDPQEIPALIKLLRDNPHISVTGILTHFSNADASNNAFTAKQYGCFAACVDLFVKAGINPTWIHAGNSAGMAKTPEGLVNAGRAGIALYGLNPLEQEGILYEEYRLLQPVLELRSFITHLRTIQTGEVVGYGNTYKATRETKVATIPMGYHEGIPRLLSNVGSCSTLKGEVLPIIGRVSMNLISLDVTDIDIAVGDEIIVYSNDSDAVNSVTRNAQSCGTISYELTTNLKPHIRRIIV